MQLSPEAKVGATVLLSIILLASMTMAIGRIDFRPSEGYEIQVMYNKVDGLREGAPVRFAGVNVGKVSFVRLEPHGVRVGVRIERDMPIPVDSQFVIATVGVLGDKHVEIHPGRAGQPLEANSLITGVDPVMMDSILVEMETTLRNLNQVVLGFAEIADSEELRGSIVESSIIMKETVGSLKQAVDQVNIVAKEVETITQHVGGLTSQLPDLPIGQIAEDIHKFTRMLAAIELEESLSDLQAFSKELTSVPIMEIAEDLQAFSANLALLDLHKMQQEISQFTNMMASLDVNPLIDEIMLITKQISALDIEARGQEIALFTSQLAELPLVDLSRDLQVITANLQEVPVVDIATNIEQLTNRLNNVPIEQLFADLQQVTSEVANLGWQERAEEIRQFTSTLAALDIELMVNDVTKDFQRFSQNIAQLDMAYLFDEITATVEGMKTLTTVVEPEMVELLMSDLQHTAANVRLASAQFNDILNQVNGDVNHLAQETGVTLAKIQLTIEGIDAIITDVREFITEIVAEGETADSLKSTLASVEKSTKELSDTIELVKREMPLTGETFDGLRSTMASIQKINEDIQNLKGMGEKVDIQSRWGLTYDFSAQEKDPEQELRRLGADIRFEFQPEDHPTFYLIGWNDLGNNNHFQLQYGKTSGAIRQRYGLIDTRLGVGIDGQISDSWSISADLRDINDPKLRLRADYQWIPDWWMIFKADDVLQGDSGGLNFGIERRF